MINFDLIHYLKPYEKLWNAEEEKKNYRHAILQCVEEYLYARSGLLEKLKLFCNEEFYRIILKKNHDSYLIPSSSISDSTLRNFIHKIRGGKEMGNLIDSLLSVTLNEIKNLSPAYRNAAMILLFPDRLRTKIRSFLMYLMQLHRYDMRLIKLKYLKNIRNPVERNTFVSDEIQSHTKELDTQDSFVDDRRQRIMQLYLENKKELKHLLDHNPFKKLQHETQNPDFKKELSSLIQSYELGIHSIEDIYKNYHTINQEMDPEVEALIHERSARYFPFHEWKLPENLTCGNPFHEGAVIDYARELLIKRLRVIRKSSHHVSLVAGERSGAMSLNPVMKLWKSKPSIFSKDLPDTIKKEMNTKETVDILLSISKIAHPQLKEMQIVKKRSAFQNHDMTLNTLKVLLIPGSVYPLRELDRNNFPEFKNNVIGEARNISELAVVSDERSILTGAWYNSYHHVFYYTIGADQSSLLPIIFHSGRATFLPAFFFALGQFVYDSLDDTKTYRRGMQLTFREVLLHYYSEEEKSRKNRGVKTGRKKPDTSRAAVRFMFAVFYSRLLLEAMTLSPQTMFRVQAVYSWFKKNTGLNLIYGEERTALQEKRKMILEYIV